MTDTSGYAQAYQQASEAFGKFVPGFEFLQGLVKNAGKSMPSMGQWIAPTLDPEELERRIEELKTVQFWLEQNARMIGATVQALEVQRMTLGALKGMNVSMGDLTEALKVKVPDIFTASAEAAASATKASAKAAEKAAEKAPEKPAAPIDEAHSDDAPGADGASPAVDPMQWWGALTQQFTALASQAMQATSEAARQATEAARQASEATSDATAQAVQAAQAAAEAAAEVAAGAAASVAPTTAAPKAAPKAATKKAAAPKAAAKKAPAGKTAKASAAAPRKATPRAGG